VANAKVPGEALATAFRAMWLRADRRPEIGGQDDDGDRPAGEVLLEGHIAVGRDQYLEAGSFSGVEKAAIG
jgi:hypothetical protein